MNALRRPRANSERKSASRATPCERSAPRACCSIASRIEIVSGQRLLADGGGRARAISISTTTFQSVGHAHPRVVAAVSEQIARLNINTRYLNRVVDDYLEALKAKFAPALSNVVLTCSGSEANDLAVRIAGSRVRRNGHHRHGKCLPRQHGGDRPPSLLRP